MKKLLLSIVLLSISLLCHSQNELPQLTIDGLPSGSVHTGSVGVLSVAGAPQYEIRSISITINDNVSNVIHVSGKSTNGIGALIRSIIPGSKVTILANVGCENCVNMKLIADYFTPS